MLKFFASATNRSRAWGGAFVASGIVALDKSRCGKTLSPATIFASNESLASAKRGRVGDDRRRKNDAVVLLDGGLERILIARQNDNVDRQSVAVKELGKGEN